MVEISFTEESDRGENIALVKTLVIDRRKSPAYYREFVQALVDFVNEGLVILRDPPETIPVRP